MLPPLSRRLPALVLLANIATLLGLLGTIFGLIEAFSAVGAADPSQRSAFLARGISQALNTTAFGLILAVPGLLVHGFLVGRVERIVEQVDGVAVRLVRALSRAAASGPGRPARPPARAASGTAAAPAPATSPTPVVPRPRRPIARPRARESSCCADPAATSTSTWRPTCEIMPLMNLFVALIPMLLISAVFLQVSTLKMNLPGDDASADAARRSRSHLSVNITTDAWVVTAAGAELTARGPRHGDVRRGPARRARRTWSRGIPTRRT